MLRFLIEFAVLAVIAVAAFVVVAWWSARKTIPTTRSGEVAAIGNALMTLNHIYMAEPPAIVEQLTVEEREGEGEGPNRPA